MNDRLPCPHLAHAQMHLELYKNADPVEAFRHFEDQRRTNIVFLLGLPAETGECKATHKAAGEITLSVRYS